MAKISLKINLKGPEENLDLKIKGIKTDNKIIYKAPFLYFVMILSLLLNINTLKKLITFVIAPAYALNNMYCIKYKIQSNVKNNIILLLLFCQLLNIIEIEPKIPNNCANISILFMTNLQKLFHY